MRGRKPARWKEKELEDYTLSNPHRLVTAMHWMGAHQQHDVVGRQIPCHAGVIDAIVLYACQLYIVEFKATKATERTVGQLERYRAAMHRIRDRHELDADHDRGAPDDIYFLSALQWRYSIKTLIVAPDFSPQTLWSADICIKARKIRGEFVYERVDMPPYNHQRDQKLTEIVDPFFNTMIERNLR